MSDVRPQSRIGLDKRIAAHTLLKMLREAGYDGSLAHPAAFHDFSYLKFTELLMDYCAASEKQAPEGYSGITQNDKRWRLLEHGCQWVSWTPTGGETVSFDPREVNHLKGMRAKADETIEAQLKLLRELMREHGGVDEPRR